MDENNNEEEMIYDNPIIVLTDEEGNDNNFEMLDLIQYEGNNYAVVMPADEDEEESEVLILKYEITNEDGTEEYVGITDEKILDAVFNIFKEKWADQYSFVENE